MEKNGQCLCSLSEGETIGGPGHHQAGDGELGAEGGEEEAESHPGNGHRDGGQEDDVDVLAVQQGQQQRGAQVAQCDEELYIDRKLKLIFRIGSPGKELQGVEV